MDLTLSQRKQGKAYMWNEEAQETTLGRENKNTFISDVKQERFILGCLLRQHSKLFSFYVQLIRQTVYSSQDINDE